MSEGAPEHISRFAELLKPGFTSAWDGAIRAITDAYNAGFQAGYEKSTLEMRNRIAGVLSEPAQGIVPPPSSGGRLAGIPLPERRAPRGSVRPTVVKALEEYGEPGLTALEIAIRTGANENSVRGMLNALAHEGVTEKRGDLWVIKK